MPTPRSSSRSRCALASFRNRRGSSIPLGTGGTVAGLLAGLRLAGLDTRVVAVTATRAPTTWRPAVKRLARAVAQRIARESGERDAGQVRLDGLRIEAGWLGPGFGRESAAGSAAQAMLDDLEGLHLDPVYTAKSMSALIDLSRAGSLPGPILFWHTYNAIPLAGAGRCRRCPDPRQPPPCLQAVGQTLTGRPEGAG